PLQLSGPFAARYWYLSHHVGLSDVLVCATAGPEAASTRPAAARKSERRIGNPPGKKTRTDYMADESDAQKPQGCRRVARVSGKPADEKCRRARDHEDRGPWIAPCAKRPGSGGLAAPEHDQREAADKIIRGEEERHHGHQL